MRLIICIICRIGQQWEKIHWLYFVCCYFRGEVQEFEVPIFLTKRKTNEIGFSVPKDCFQGQVFFLFAIELLLRNEFFA